MRYETICSSLIGQLDFHDRMLKGTRDRAKVRQELSTVVLGIMVVGLGAFAGSVGFDYQNGSTMDSQEAFAAWLVIVCGVAGMAWVMASLLFSMDAQSGPDIEQPITYADLGRDGAVSEGLLAGWHAMSDEGFYKALAKSCILALHSREAEVARIRVATARSQSALFIGLAVVAIGAMASLVTLGISWA